MLTSSFRESKKRGEDVSPTRHSRRECSEHFDLRKRREGERSAAARGKERLKIVPPQIRGKNEEEESKCSPRRKCAVLNADANREKGGGK